MTRLIEEEEAFKVLSAYYKHSTPVQDSALHDALSRVPTAVPVKRGKWEEQGVFINEKIEEWQEARCSVCHLFHTTPYKYTFIKYAYCPYCGARMDKDERD